jgi:hypothetical protein
MIRTQYITSKEYEDIIGTVCEIKDIYEASETIKYHMFDRLNEYTVSTAPDNLKLATAYQVQYMQSGIDDDYTKSGNISIGKYSESNNAETSERFKISPKSQRYLVDGGLLRRTV